MCGLNGIFAYHTAANSVSEAELIATRDQMRARGPDGAGCWIEPQGRCGLGHRRLAIIDLSDRALQPMQDESGDLAVVFNGEIYNFAELRDELQASGQRFRTNSDTEVLLHLYGRYGSGMVKRLRGMFSFAIWDQRRRGLLLARDPYGIKPLYYSNDGWTFRFASQVKALLAGGAVSREAEPAGLTSFFLWGAVQEPFTLFREIRALPAGHTQWIDAAGPRVPTCFADVSGAFGVGDIRPRDREEVFQASRAALAESVRAHLVADVEVAIFLSGGIDSGSLLGLMREAGQQKIRAITLSFAEYAGTTDDEVPLAAEVARLNGAEHLVRRIGHDEFHREIPKILGDMDQPSIDGVNSWFVSKAAAEAGVKVAISGVGGDELLAGYPSFTDIPLWNALNLPTRFLPGFGVALRKFARSVAPNAGRPKALGFVEYGGTLSRAYLLRRALFLPFELEACLDRAIIREGLARLKPLKRVRDFIPKRAHPIAKIAALESSIYMRNSLLRDTDWAGMSHSVEIRTPLVDWKLLQAMAPLQHSLASLRGKTLLARAPQIPLPDSVIDRSKTGFTVPMEEWLVSQERTSPRAGKQGSASRTWAHRVAREFEPDTSMQPSGS